MSPIIEVKNVSKSFKLPHEKVDSLREGFTGLFTKRTFDTFDAVKDVSFEVEKGDFFGIIGRNGSGKSTLLKIIAGIYTPNSGKVALKEKISPFLELGVGFNPELTARENVFLNGVVLGLSHKEVEEKYEEIVAFAGLEKFMDSKLKNFSSGMQVRLAFSVAVQSPAPILLIDEVLAVGDAEFQEKCFKKFHEYKKQGRTIVFISHDLSSIEKFCSRVVVLNNGKVVFNGKPRDALTKYQESLMDDPNETPKTSENPDNPSSKKKLATINSVSVFDKSMKVTSRFNTGDSIRFRIEYNAKEKIANPIVGLAFYDQNDILVSGPNTGTSNFKITEIFGKGHLDYTIENCPLLGGKYSLSLGIFNEDALIPIDFKNNIASFTINAVLENQHGLIKWSEKWEK